MDTCPIMMLEFPDTEETRHITHRPPIFCTFPLTNEPPILFTVMINLFKMFLESELCPKRQVPIFFSPYPGDIFPIPHIFMNTEQLSRACELGSIVKASRKNVVEIWDYSLANVQILKYHGVDARHVPLITPDWYMEQLRKFREPYVNNFEYDVGFCGSESERRKIIFDALVASGISFYNVKKHGEEKDMELAKCKIMINVHVGEDYKIFESERCEQWLRLGVPIISEHSFDNDPRCINVKYEDLVQTVIEFLREASKKEYLEGNYTL